MSELTLVVVVGDKKVADIFCINFSYRAFMRSTRVIKDVKTILIIIFI